MEEAELLCDQLVIMDQGKVIADGSPSALLKKNFNHSYVCLDREDFNNAHDSSHINCISSPIEIRAVSYTHLTLPTICSV